MASSVKGDSLTIFWKAARCSATNSTGPSGAARMQAMDCPPRTSSISPKNWPGPIRAIVTPSSAVRAAFQHHFHHAALDHEEIINVLAGLQDGAVGLVGEMLQLAGGLQHLLVVQQRQALGHGFVDQFPVRDDDGAGGALGQRWVVRDHGDGLAFFDQAARING